MHEKGAYDVDEDEGDNELEGDDVERDSCHGPCPVLLHQDPQRCGPGFRVQGSGFRVQGSGFGRRKRTMHILMHAYEHILIYVYTYGPGSVLLNQDPERCGPWF